ncbi:thioredoxin-like domain-containing protein [Stenotrophomonas sp. S41]|uniref:thioredoxin-like domain-containing protein n=1 Tax=Stenotrophomonas sp. S41 TaxID=2767464 RepID=UPI002D7E70B0|nr:thioredoxin-like domain-containing protein [Stenotrophomonas sp. S41]
MIALAGAAQSSDKDRRHQIEQNLVVPNEGRSVPYEWARPPSLIALYFGASWCGPCHAFTPELIRIRDALREGGADTEVVYVSSDESELEMRRYMRSEGMPWPAIDYRKLQSLPAIRSLGGMAPPNLVLISSDGKMIANGWHGRRYGGVQPVLQTWLTEANKALINPPGPVHEQ